MFRKLLAAAGIAGIIGLSAACSPNGFQYSNYGRVGQVSAAAGGDDGGGSKFRAGATCRSPYGWEFYAAGPWADVNDSGQAWNGRWYSGVDCGSGNNVVRLWADRSW